MGDAASVASAASAQSQAPRMAIARWCKNTLKLSGIRKSKSEARKPHSETQKAAKQAIRDSMTGPITAQIPIEPKPVYVIYTPNNTSYRTPNKKIIDQAVTAAITGGQSREEMVSQIQEQVTELCKNTCDALTVGVSKKRGIEYTQSEDTRLKGLCTTWAQARNALLSLNDDRSKAEMKELRDLVKEDTPEVLDYIMHQPAGLVLNIRSETSDGPVPFMLSARRRGIRKRHENISEQLEGWEPESEDVQELREQARDFILTAWEGSGGDYSLSLKRKKQQQ